MTPAVFPSLIARTRQTLDQAVARYTATLQDAAEGSAAQVATVKAGLEQIQQLNTKLESRCLRVAMFGLVSRGKSAVINALVGETVLETGPLHGVTRWPRSVYWQAEDAVDRDGNRWQIELVDTPGLDEVGGDVRAEMAQTVAQQADLILFVVAGDITRTEYLALLELQRQQKPLLLVFNKSDLYPEVDQQAIATALNDLRQSLIAEGTTTPLALDQVVMIAASPAPWPVRVEWPDGRITQEWETSAPAIAPLKEALLTLVREDGSALVALNALHRARTIEDDLVRSVSQLRGEQADALIWQFAKYKAIAVALNPIAGLDLAGGLLSDLVMIRNLARLYGFPLTNYEAGKLWQSILKSSGLLLLSELGSLLMGAGKTTAALVSLADSATGITALAGAMTAQASAAGYGTYAVGKAAKTYLERGCTWGPEGVSATLAGILQDTETTATLSRLRQNIAATLAPAALKP